MAKFLWEAPFRPSTRNLDEWVKLGDGSRVPGGWRLAGVSLRLNSGIRARGFVAGGLNNGSSWYVESLLQLAPPPLMILLNDGGAGFKSNRFGFNFSGAVGQDVVIEASSNFLNWVPLFTNTMAAVINKGSNLPWSFATRLRCSLVADHCGYAPRSRLAGWQNPSGILPPFFLTDALPQDYPQQKALLLSICLLKIIAVLRTVRPWNSVQVQGWCRGPSCDIRPNCETR